MDEDEEPERPDTEPDYDTEPEVLSPREADFAAEQHFAYLDRIHDRSKVTL
jgi:hypothetical protein